MYTASASADANLSGTALGSKRCLAPMYFEFQISYRPDLFCRTDLDHSSRSVLQKRSAHGKSGGRVFDYLSRPFFVTESTRFTTGNGSWGRGFIERLSFRCDATEMSGSPPSPAPPYRFTCCMRSETFLSSSPGASACLAWTASHLQHAHACFHVFCRYYLT